MTMATMTGFTGWKSITIAPVTSYAEGDRPTTAYRVIFTAHNPRTAPRGFTFDTYQEASEFAHGAWGALIHGVTVPSPRRVLAIDE